MKMWFQFVLDCALRNRVPGQESETWILVYPIQIVRHWISNQLPQTLVLCMKSKESDYTEFPKAE